MRTAVPQTLRPYKTVLHQTVLHQTVLHGNAYAAEKKVTLAFERTAEDLVIIIRDQGKGMDLSKIPNPLAPENLLKTSGR